MPRRPATHRPFLVGARPGARLGPYEICLELGSGGMATVFLARLPGRAGMHRFVALKCLQSELTRNPGAVEMFLDEARITASINHPNVCTVIDYDEQHGVSYLAMEYLMGETLSSVRRQLALVDKLPPALHAGLVARIIADACEGLHAAHELKDASGDPVNVVHRDISPENIMLTFDGSVKLFDFGIALSTMQRNHTRTGVLKGKYSYMQPEVLKGHPPDRRSDIWGMGVVLWELLTTKRLFDCENDVDTLKAVTEMKLRPPSQAREGLPAELDAIVMKALQRDPAKRYQTARELGRCLTGFLAEHRLAVGLAELSELMDRLFPTGRACKRQVLETVQRMDETSKSVEIDLDEEDSVIVDGRTVVRRTPVELDRAVEEAEAAAGKRVRGTPVEPLRAPRRRGPLVLAAAALAAVVAALAIVALVRAWPTAVAAPPPPTTQATTAPVEPGYVLDVTPVESNADGVLLRVRMISDNSCRAP